MYICTYNYNAKPDQEFYLNSTETYSEPFPTSKKGGYLIEGNYFFRKLHLRSFEKGLNTLSPSKP